jgi:hypothetical protein
MSLFHSRRSSQVRPSRSSRRIEPAVEGCEPRLLQSGATVHGTATAGLVGAAASAEVAMTTLSKMSKMVTSAVVSGVEPADILQRKH